MSRRAPGRATRQILSGSQLSSTRDQFNAPSNGDQQPSLAYWYLCGLAALVVVAAVIWAIWGMGPVSPILLLLAFGLIAAWLVV